MYSLDHQWCHKAEFAQEGIFFMLQFFALWILLIKKMEIEKISELLLKVEYYSSVPNRRVGQNKRAGGKILKKH